MKELIEALGPWPTLQGIAIGMAIASVGVWAILKGMRGSAQRDVDIDEMKAKWKLYDQVDHIHENSFAMVKHLEKLVETQLMIHAAINRLVDTRWNKSQ